jgi:hypothetical protein
VKILKPSLLVSTPHLIKYHQEQDLLRKVTTGLNKLMNIWEQIEADSNLEEKVDEEDAQEKSMEEVVERLATFASKRQLK